MSVVLCVAAFAQKATLTGVTDEVKKAAAEQSAAQTKASGEQAAAMGQVVQRQRAAEASAIERTVSGRVASALAAEKLEARLERIEEALEKSDREKKQAEAEAKESRDAMMKLVQESTATVIIAILLGGGRILYSMVIDSRRHSRTDEIMAAMGGKVDTIAGHTNGMAESLMKLAGDKKFRAGKVAGARQERALADAAEEETAAHGR
jgi:hypothetical protein